MRTLLARIEACAKRVGATDAARRAAEIGAWTERPTAHVVVCGEFKRGKSSLVNALLETDMCPTDVLPETAVPAVLEYSAHRRAEIVRMSGETESIPADRDGLSRLSARSGENLAAIRLVRVGLPSAILKEGLAIVDTPGVNDLSQQRAEVTYGFLPLADAAVLLLDASQPVTRSEAEFLESHLLPNCLDRVTFLLGKCDRLDGDELQEALSGARERLASLVQRQVRVLPISVAAGCLDGARGLDELRTELVHIARDAKVHRLSLVRRRVVTLLDELSAGIDRRQDALSLTPEVREQAKGQFHSVKNEVMARKNALFEYVDTFAGQTLRELIGRSIDIVKARTIEDLVHQAEQAERVEEFVKKRVPYVVRRQLSMWYEAKEGEIRAFQRRFLDQLASEYSKGLATRLELSASATPLNIRVLDVPESAEVTSRTGELLRTRLVPMAVPLAIGLALGGPLFVVAGSVVGGVLSSHAQEDSVRRQRANARVTIESEVPRAFENFKSALVREVQSWVDRVRHILADDLARISQALEERFQAEGVQERILCDEARVEVAALREQTMEV